MTTREKGNLAWSLCPLQHTAQCSRTVDFGMRAAQSGVRNQPGAGLPHFQPSKGNLVPMHPGSWRHTQACVGLPRRRAACTNRRLQCVRVRPCHAMVAEPTRSPHGPRAGDGPPGDFPPPYQEMETVVGTSIRGTPWLPGEPQGDDSLWGNALHLVWVAAWHRKPESGRIRGLHSTGCRNAGWV